ncbi:MAG: hypothetical protein QXI58_01885 [Candidatus Micrarchaeia archaeon]
MKIFLFKNARVLITPQGEWFNEYLKPFKSFKSVKDKGIYFYNKRTKEYFCYDYGEGSNQEFETDDFYVKGAFINEEVLEKIHNFYDKGLFSFDFICNDEGMFLHELLMNSSYVEDFLKGIDDWSGIRELKVRYDIYHADPYQKGCSITFGEDFKEVFRKDFLNVMLLKISNRYLGRIHYHRSWYHGSDAWYTLTFISASRYRAVDINFQCTQADVVLTFLKHFKERSFKKFLATLQLFSKVKIEE